LGYPPPSVPLPDLWIITFSSEELPERAVWRASFTGMSTTFDERIGFAEVVLELMRGDGRWRRTSLAAAIANLSNAPGAGKGPNE
jgi:hypothetical protein